MLFDIERGIVGKSAAERLAVRQELSAPVLADLKNWMQAERGKLSRHSPVAKAMDYMLKRWELFARFLDDGRMGVDPSNARRTGQINSIQLSDPSRRRRSTRRRGAGPALSV